MSLVRSRLAPVVVLVAVAIVALGVTQPPTTALAADDYLVIGRAELLALPTSGTAWEFVKSTADATWGPVDLANQDSKVDSQAIAAALVYARTGDTTYRAKVVGALRDLQAWRGSVDSLAWFRQVGGFAIAADLVDYRDPSFVAYLAEMRTSSPNDPDGQGDHAVWSNPVVTHEDSVNNYGAFAGATRVAISAYLGDTVDLASAWNVYQGFLGNRSAYSGFRGQVSDLYAAAKPWACDPTRAGFVPVNGPCSSSGVDLDGVIPGDAYRDELGLLYPLPRLSKGIGYTQETLQG
ncbi:MAG TPA: hypothetical protein VKB30_10840, partial [Candidatus Limnocylindrales bacterium]|nr:hypothetical protein [Candidatus Limnocylindrales bacterium]